MKPRIIEALKKPVNLFYIGFAAANVAMFYVLAQYFSTQAVLNAKAYYKAGGKMQQEIPEEFKEEFYQKVKRKRQFKTAQSKGNGQDSSNIDIIN